VGLAQVSLTLDNTDGQLPIDYSDVTISRRLYRSGESEYYINNTHCRLKDIQELFMDTGIGKEGYSIIGQGKIDAILSGKPEERRSLLEEAAGIVKFKSRKEEAEKRLENTEQNLVRINDILKTYEERLEPLRLESEKARTFLELSNSLKEKEVNLIIYSIDNIKSKVDYIKNTVESIQIEISEITKRKDICKDSLKSLNYELEKHELQTKNNQEEYYENKSDSQNINSEISLLEERLKNLYTVIEKNSEEIDTIHEKLQGLQTFKKSQEDNLKQSQDQLLFINNDIDISEKEIINLNSSISEGENTVNKLKDDDIELLRLISETKNSIKGASFKRLLS
jgi:chromosome segregation protein